MAKDGNLDIRLADQTLSLLPQRAVFWAARKTLLIADLHLGKDDTFRRAGIPVPAAVAEHDLQRLSDLILDFTPDRLIVLGDFLHARPSPNDVMHGLLARWREQHALLDVLLVRGNHDRHAGDPAASLGFDVVNEPSVDGPFELRHHPLNSEAKESIAVSLRDAGEASGTSRRPRATASRSDAAMTEAHDDLQGHRPACCDERVVLAGHLHPGVTVKLDRHHARRVPCFHATPEQLILPAFGRFTGTARIHPNTPGELYAVAPSRVIRLPKPVLA